MSERPNHNLALDLVRVTEAAALAAGRWMGCGQKEAGDAAAVKAMRLILSTIDMDGMVVIREGAKDEAPMLYDGEQIGNGLGPAVDVAVDPIEGIALLAYGQPDAISVVSVAPRGTMWSPGPAYYMNKLVVRREARSALHAGRFDGAQRRLLSAPVTETLSAIATALCKPLRDLTVFVLDKPRHQKLIAACAVRALGDAMLGQLAPQKEEERKIVESAGLDINCVLTESDLVRSDDVFFAATGITDGVLMPGVHYTGDGASTVSIVMRGKTGTIRKIHAEHQLDNLREISAVEY
jgi:fructose-1,6-bisphosphatase II